MVLGVLGHPPSDVLEMAPRMLSSVPLATLDAARSAIDNNARRSILGSNPEGPHIEV